MKNKIMLLLPILLLSGCVMPNLIVSSDYNSLDSSTSYLESSSDQQEQTSSSNQEITSSSQNNSSEDSSYKEEIDIPMQEGINVRFASSEIEGCYEVTISSTIANSILTNEIFFEEYFNTLNGVIIDNKIVENADLYYYQNLLMDCKKVIVGANISTVGYLGEYLFADTIVFGEDVSKIKTNAIRDCFALTKINFMGDLPELEADSLWRRNVANQLEEVERYCPTIYYNEGAIGFETQGYKIQGCALKMVGKSYTNEPMSIDEYSLRSANKCLEIASLLFDSYENSTYDYLQFMPACDISKYKQIKDLAIDITKNASSQTQKAQIIFDWLQTNITYTNEAMFYPVHECFEKRQAVCAGYALLMHDMLAAINIPSYYIHGTADTEVDIFKIITNTYHSDDNHAWLVCKLDGKITYCDPTWGDFDITVDNLVSSKRIPLTIEGISVVPEGFTPYSYVGCTHYENGNVSYYENGRLSVSSMITQTYNYVYEVGYTFALPNGYERYNHEKIEPYSSFKDTIVDSSITEKMSYDKVKVYRPDFISYKYKDVIRYVIFEKIYYNNVYELEYSENFTNDENGTIYLKKDDGTLSVLGSCSNSSSISIDESYADKLVNEISPEAFMFSTYSEIILPDTIEKICFLAFNSSNVTSLDLPKNLKTIEPGAFANCYNLKEITMYSNVQFIGFDDFTTKVQPHLIFGFNKEESDLVVRYIGNKEQFDQINFYNPYDEGNTFDKEQYDHVLSFMVFC